MNDEMKRRAAYLEQRRREMPMYEAHVLRLAAGETLRDILRDEPRDYVKRSLDMTGDDRDT